MKRLWMVAGLVAVAMFLGVTAGTASAAQQDGQRFPPFSNACLKVGGFLGPPAFSETGQVVLLDCSKPSSPGFSSRELERLFRACRQAGKVRGATSTAAFLGQNRGAVFVNCVLSYGP
jgi:hypothetical protein